MKRIVFFIGVLLFFLSKSACACEPCQKTLNLLETMHKAEVIVVGQKIADGAPSEALNPDYAQAEWIEIGIIEVLKGSPQQSSLKVNSWDGMCPYGIVVDEKTYVFFLVKRQVNDEEYEYDAVNFGCGHKTLVVNNDSVNFQGQAVALQDFIKILRTDTPHQ